MLALGFFDGILGVTWIVAHSALDATIDQLGWVLASMGLGSALGAITAPYLTRSLHPLTLLQGALILQLCLMAVIFIAPSVAVLAAFYGVRGLANGLAHATLNGYFGPRIGAKKLMTVHGSWGVGTAVAGLIAGITLDLSAPWFTTYLIGTLPCMLSLVLLHRIHQRFDALGVSQSSGPSASGSPLHWTLGIIAIIASGALYVGLEQSVGNWSASLLNDQFLLDGGLTGIAVGLFWGALTIGRFTLGLLPFSERVLLITAAVSVLAALGLFLLAPTPAVAMVALCLAGLSMAPIAPYVLSLGSQMVSHHQHMTMTSLQIVAFSLGAALIPGVLGLSAASLGLSSIYIGFLCISAALCAGVIVALRDNREKQVC
ncbi:MAG: hypothetical protein EBS77_07565 [Gammaproteobacteria bacterium]|nr:hypothetical protein [Gammaproteobacteria bacterium]